MVGVCEMLGNGRAPSVAASLRRRRPARSPLSTAAAAAWWRRGEGRERAARFRRAHRAPRRPRAPKIWPDAAALPRLPPNAGTAAESALGTQPSAPGPGTAASAACAEAVTGAAAGNIPDFSAKQREVFVSGLSSHDSMRMTPLCG